MPSPSPERALLYPTCGARLRRRSGRCSRIVKTPGARCPVHSGGELSPEGHAIISAAAKMRHARQRVAIRRNEIRRYPQGRKRKYLIPRHWRFKLCAADEAAVLAHMAAYDARVRGGEPRPTWQAITSTASEARALADFEKSLVIAMNDAVRPLSRERMERLYDLARHAEHALGLPGMDVRLKRLEWERHQFLLRGLPTAPGDRAAAKRGGHEMSGAGPAPASLGSEWLASRRPPPDDFRDQLVPPYTVESADQLRVEIDARKRHLAQFNLAESTARSLDAELARALHGRNAVDGAAAQLAILDRRLAGMERAYAMSETIVAGRDAAAEQRAMRPRQQERLLTIAPWLRRS